MLTSITIGVKSMGMLGSGDASPNILSRWYTHWKIPQYFYCTPCLKNVPPLTCYNLDIHSLITIIFGTRVTKKVGNQNILYFPTSPNLCFCITWGNRKSENCVFSLKCCILYAKNTRKTKDIKISPGYS